MVIYCVVQYLNLDGWVVLSQNYVFLRKECSMECVVCWGEGMSFIVEMGSGYIVVMDGVFEGGGCNLVLCFMEMVLLGMGGCIVYDVVFIFKCGCQDIIGCEVWLQVECVDIDFKVFIKINFYFVVMGKGFKFEVVEWVIKLLVEKYCLVLIMFGKIVEIIYIWEIVEV